MREPTEAEPKGNVPPPPTGGLKSPKATKKPRKVQASVKPHRPAARRVP